MEKKTIWLVHSRGTYGVEPYYSFYSEEKAKKKYKEIVNYLRNRKPDDKDHWSYKVTSDTEDVNFTLFEATCNYMKERFAVLYTSLELQ